MQFLFDRRDCVCFEGLVTAWRSSNLLLQYKLETVIFFDPFRQSIPGDTTTSTSSNTRGTRKNTHIYIYIYIYIYKFMFQ